MLTTTSRPTTYGPATPAAVLPDPRLPSAASRGPVVAALVAFGALFGRELYAMAAQWVSDPEAGHGLLLAFTAIWLAWQAPRERARTPAYALATAMVAVTCVAAIFTMLGASSRTGARLVMMFGLAALAVLYGGVPFLRAHAFPAILLLLAVPLPRVLISDIALPLQLFASRLGASLLEARHIPVFLEGNILHLPGRDLFVSEACSGIRSLWSLASLAVLIAGLWLRTMPMRVLLVAVAVPIAVFLNVVRVFLIGFLTFLVDPKFGDGFVHLTEGWLMFLAAIALLAGVARIVYVAEQWGARKRAGGVA